MTYEATRAIQALITGRDITGCGAFAPHRAEDLAATISAGGSRAGGLDSRRPLVVLGLRRSSTCAPRTPSGRLGPAS